MNAPQRYRQPDRHVIRSINLREVAKTIAPAGSGVEQLDAVIEQLKRSLADWPKSRNAA